ncbi:hypothetical protein C8T65DRAFT_79577 [Cerioporus squamosus]|nr:hypothetical protein C8T65DRAFT_79577 [Cerioporus squamosus]
MVTYLGRFVCALLARCNAACIESCWKLHGGMLGQPHGGGGSVPTCKHAGGDIRFLRPCFTFIWSSTYVRNRRVPKRRASIRPMLPFNC